VIAQHEAGGGAAERSPRERNFDVVAGLVAERVEKSQGRISAKRLLPAARAAGMEGRRGISGGWSRRRSCCGAVIIIVAAGRWCGRRVSTW
jgi:hypothetical protein